MSYLEAKINRNVAYAHQVQEFTQHTHTYTHCEMNKIFMVTFK